MRKYEKNVNTSTDTLSFWCTLTLPLPPVPPLPLPPAPPPLYVSTECIHHEDRSMSNAQALLQSAWLGDAVSLRKCVEVRDLNTDHH